MQILCSHRVKQCFFEMKINNWLKYTILTMQTRFFSTHHDTIQAHVYIYIYICNKIITFKLTFILNTWKYDSNLKCMIATIATAVKGTYKTVMHTHSLTLSLLHPLAQRLSKPSRFPWPFGLRIKILHVSPECCNGI